MLLLLRLAYMYTVCICRNESLRDNINAAKTLVIILIVFFVCWFPFFLTYTLSFVGKVRKREALGLFTFIEAHTFTMREQKGQTVIVHQPLSSNQDINILCTSSIPSHFDLLFLLLQPGLSHGQIKIFYISPECDCYFVI